MNKKINVVGLGYIGLPTAAMFAKAGLEVIGVDANHDVVDIINQGKIHIEEPGLGELIKEAVEKGHLKASYTPTEADAFIIAVPTPNKDDDYLSCDLKYVISATESVLPYLKKGDTVIIESTIEPRATEDHIMPIIEKAGFKVGEDIFLAHCPERVLPGQILYELVHNNRIVGGITVNCTDHAAEIYTAFVEGEIIKTEAKTAEMSKLMENTFRDVNIALANELAKVCNSLDIDVLDVIQMANKHPRVNIHTPGPGVGGHCLAIDPYFIYAKNPEEAKLIKLSRDINNSMPDYVVDNIEKLLNYDHTKTIATLGVTYKPDVDDLRESPALKIVDKLIAKGYKVNICDPHVKNENYLALDQAIEGVDLIAVLTGHAEFKKDLASLKTEALLFDATASIKNVNVINYGNLWRFTKK